MRIARELIVIRSHRHTRQNESSTKAVSIILKSMTVLGSPYIVSNVTETSAKAHVHGWGARQEGKCHTRRAVDASYLSASKIRILISWKKLVMSCHVSWRKVPSLPTRWTYIIEGDELPVIHGALLLNNGFKDIKCLNKIPSASMEYVTLGMSTRTSHQWYAQMHWQPIQFQTYVRKDMSVHKIFWALNSIWLGSVTSVRTQVSSTAEAFRAQGWVNSSLIAFQARNPEKSFKSMKLFIYCICSHQPLSCRYSRVKETNWIGVCYILWVSRSLYKQINK